MVTLLDSDGNELATFVAHSGRGSNRLVVGRVIRGKGKLLRHYFAEGRRSVQIQSGGFLLRGVLETSWLGAERQWAVRLTPIALRDEARAVESEAN
jgi:hypothetical protein